MLTREFTRPMMAHSDCRMTTGKRHQTLKAKPDEVYYANMPMLKEAAYTRTYDDRNTLIIFYLLSSLLGPPL